MPHRTCPMGAVVWVSGWIRLRDVGTGSVWGVWLDDVAGDVPFLQPGARMTPTDAMRLLREAAVMFPERELVVLGRIVARMRQGLEQYGPLYPGKRVWHREAQEEHLDACVYLACALEEPATSGGEGVHPMAKASKKPMKGGKMGKKGSCK